MLSLADVAAAKRPRPDQEIEWFHPLIAHAVGNCVVDHVALAKQKLRYGHAVGLVYDPSIDFHLDMIAANPYLDAVCPIGAFPGDPRSLPEPTFGRTWNYLIENTEPVRLRVPEAVVEHVQDLLELRGISASDRVISIHAREPGYKYYRKDHEPERFVDVANFIKVAEHYVERGFKVIRIGDPSCTPFPHHPAIFDAAHLPHKRLAHDMAFVARSDLLLATDSGVWPVGVALGTPTVLSNSCHGQPAMGTVKHWFPWEAGHTVLNKTLVFEGQKLPPRLGVRLFRGNRWRQVPGKTQLFDNSAEQLIEAVDGLLRQHGQQLIKEQSA